MAVSKIRSKWVAGLLEFFGVSSGATIFKITESGVEGNIKGNVVGSQKGAILGSVAISKAVDYALSDAEKANLAFSLKMTAGSKTFTLGLSDGQVALVYNEGTNTFTVKNVSDDDGTSLETTKLVLIIASTTANASKVIALN